jgi:hypothetical protein
VSGDGVVWTLGAGPFREPTLACATGACCMWATLSALHLAGGPSLGGVETDSCTPRRRIATSSSIAAHLTPPALTHGLSASPPYYPHTTTMANANVNWRTINIDALDPDSPANFDLSSLTPAVAPVSTADVQASAQQIRTLLRGGDNEGALQGALENPPYGADDKGKVRRRRMLPHHHARELPAVTAHASGSRRPGRDARRRETG